MAGARAGEPFDLAVAPFVRTALLRTGDVRWTLALVVHHIVIDGWGLGVALRELGAFYAAALRVPAPQPPTDAEAGLRPLTVSYPQVGRWQREYLGEARLEELRGYWTRKLAGASLDLSLPWDRPRPKKPSGQGATVSARIGPDWPARWTRWPAGTGPRRSPCCWGPSASCCAG